MCSSHDYLSVKVKYFVLATFGFKLLSGLTPSKNLVGGVVVLGLARSTPDRVVRAQALQGFGNFYGVICMVCKGIDHGKMYFACVYILILILLGCIPGTMPRVLLDAPSPPRLPSTFCF